MKIAIKLLIDLIFYFAINETVSGTWSKLRVFFLQKERNQTLEFLYSFEEWFIY